MSLGSLDTIMPREALSTATVRERPGPLADARGTVVSVLFAFCLLFSGVLQAQEAPPAPVGVEAFDTPNDKGDSVSLTWPMIPNEETLGVVYEVRIAASDAGPFRKIADVAAGSGWKSDAPELFWYFDGNKGVHWVQVDPTTVFASASQAELEKAEQALSVIEEAMAKGGAESASAAEDRRRLVRERAALRKHVEAEAATIRGTMHWYQVAAKSSAGEGVSSVVSAAAVENPFDFAKLPHFILMLILCGGVLGYIVAARRNPNLFLRKIPGLAALDEAIGRATEMGKPLYYMTGRLGLSDNEKSVSTIAAIAVLGKVSERVANYGCLLKVPHTDPVVNGVCQEVTQEAYLRAGRPDAWREEINFFVSGDQFSYTASVNSMMTREKPAAVLYFGYYYAEALLLAETGNSVGAIQVGATDADAQLPFFFAACDYTLIGEELYAAAAYVSREPVLVGTLRGQDLGKAVLIILVLAGSVAATLGAIHAGPLDDGWPAAVQGLLGRMHYLLDMLKPPAGGM